MILSASRRTDIPAFFSEWFFKRIEEGFVFVRNPFNRLQVSKIVLSPDLIDCIVFWTKNPSDSFIEKLPRLDELGYKYYFQFTLTSYDQTIEKNVPRKKEVIEKFRRISKLIGKDRIIWRYDPILLSDHFDMEYHKKYFEYLVRALSPYTEKCIISFLDFYPKIEKVLSAQGVSRMTLEEMTELAIIISSIAARYNLKVESCCEEIDLSQFGITKSHCIDGALIQKITGKEAAFKPDKNQRAGCGCVSSVDIGVYNTCRHNCIYCYANRSCDVQISDSVRITPTTSGSSPKPSFERARKQVFGFRFK